MFLANKYGQSLTKWRGLSHVLRVIIGKEQGGETIYAKFSDADVIWFMVADY